jgi:hypothetical protein
MFSIGTIARRTISASSLFETFQVAAIYLSNLVLVIRPIRGGGLPGCQKKPCSHQVTRVLSALDQFQKFACKI